MKMFFWDHKKPVDGLVATHRVAKQKKKKKSYIEYNGIQASYPWKREVQIGEDAHLE